MKDPVKRMKIKAKNWEKTSRNCISNLGIVYRIYINSEISTAKNQFNYKMGKGHEKTFEWRRYSKMGGKERPFSFSLE